MGTMIWGEVSVIDPEEDKRLISCLESIFKAA
jgi:hypothetical protein